MSEVEAKRNRVSALLDAGMRYEKIASIVPCSLGLNSKVKRLKDEEKHLGRKPGSGGHNQKRTAEFMGDLTNAIEASPMTSMRKHAKNFRVDPKTIRKAVKDLGAFSYVRRRRQLLTGTMKETRVIKGKRLLSWMKNHPSTVRIFSDKKLWTVDQARNSRNDRYLAYCIDQVPPINTSKHPASCMMLGVVASDSKRMDPYWFPKGSGLGPRSTWRS